MRGKRSPCTEVWRNRTRVILPCSGHVAETWRKNKSSSSSNSHTAHCDVKAFDNLARSGAIAVRLKTIEAVARINKITVASPHDVFDTYYASVFNSGCPSAARNFLCLHSIAEFHKGWLVLCRFVESSKFWTFYPGLSGTRLEANGYRRHRL